MKSRVKSGKRFCGNSDRQTESYCFLVGALEASMSKSSHGVVQLPLFSLSRFGVSVCILFISLSVIRPAFIYSFS